LLKNETKISISEYKKKAVIIIQTQMEYRLTTVAANHQSTIKGLQRTNKQVPGQSEKLQ
jgi:hypothetical protein